MQRILTVCIFFCPQCFRKDGRVGQASVRARDAAFCRQSDHRAEGTIGCTKTEKQCEKNMAVGLIQL